MVSEEELFISFSPNAYRINKSNILRSQADLLQSLKRLHNLKVIANQKHDIRRRLSKLLFSTISEVDSLQEKIPNPKIPKALEKHEKQINKPEGSFPKHDDIEDELKLIQKKLRELNN